MSPSGFFIHADARSNRPAEMERTSIGYAQPENLQVQWIERNRDKFMAAILPERNNEIRKVMASWWIIPTTAQVKEKSWRSGPHPSTILPAQRSSETVLIIINIEMNSLATSDKLHAFFHLHVKQSLDLHHIF